MIRDFISSASFEFRTAFKKPSTYVYFGLLFALSALAAFVMGGGLKGASVSFGFSDRMFINSPLSILYVTTIFATFATSIVAAFFGQAICKDYLANMDQVIFSKPLHFRAFLLGRFVGTLAVLTVIFSSLVLGMAFATVIPGILPTAVGPATWLSYAQPYFVSVVPNIFIFGALFFTLAATTKKMAPVYIAGILVLMGWMLSGVLAQDIENKVVSSLIDAFGLNGVSSTTQYWSVTQKQTGLVWWTSYYLYNRAMWMLVGFAALGHAVYHFSPLANKANKKKLAPELTPKELVAISEKAHRVSDVTKTTSGWDFKWRTFTAQLRLELSQAFKNIYFVCIALASLCHMGIAGTQIGKMFGTTTLPVTYQVIGMVSGLLGLYMLIIITFWCGELVWRDRDTRFNQIIDSTPSSTAVMLLSKYVAINALVWVFLALFMGMGIVVQTAKGYYNYEVGQYFFRLFVIEASSFLFTSALALGLQVLTNNKYIGHGLMIAYYVYYAFSGQMGVENNLLIPDSAPLAAYSDMNAYGHFLWGHFAFRTLWTLLAAILVLVAYLFWPRGTETQWRKRLREGNRRWSNSLKAVSLGLVTTFAVMAGYIYYNTHVLSEFQTRKAVEARRVSFEKTYKKYAELPQPTTRSIFPKVDLFPHAQSMNAEVDYRFENTSGQAIDTVFFNVPRGPMVSKSFEFSVPARLDIQDDDHGVWIYKLEPALAPGKTFTMKFLVSFRSQGFGNTADQTVIVDNGTFLHNYDYFPMVGYSESSELSQTKTRAKYGLASKPRMKPIDDQKSWNRNYITENSHWIDFETIVSTSADQFAIAPGYLIKEWTEGDRRYFHYKMDDKILDFYAYISGKFDVKREMHNGVNIEVYYHPGHDKNVDSMIQASKDGLDYFGKNFSPYQHRQYRIIEFPRYATYAQAFPNTIPFSEATGFIAKVNPDDPEDIDYPYYITAHELAHQWWAHQVIGAGVQGATLMSESLAQYSALMLMEHKFGRERIKKFLKYELTSYLTGRGSEPEKEYPLILNENQQYIHYQKGSMAFYGLKDAVGEDNLNRAIKAFVSEYAYKGPPYPLSTDFLRVLKGNIASQHHGLIDELFGKIILYNNRVVKTVVTPKDGKHQIDISINAEKLVSDEAGNEKPTDFKSAIDIGVRNAKGDFIYLKKHQVVNGETSIQLLLDEAPKKAGIDPLNVLIDKNPTDNESSVSFL